MTEQVSVVILDGSAVAIALILAWAGGRIVLVRNFSGGMMMYLSACHVVRRSRQAGERHQHCCGSLQGQHQQQ